MNTKQKPAKTNISNVMFTKFKINDIAIDNESSIRHEYDKEKLQELAESIRQNNNELLQPILISKTNINYALTKIDPSLPCTYAYKVIAGRRRFLACRDILKLDKISAIVKEFDSFESEFSAQFAENEERENWTDYDYTKAISLLKEKKKDISQAEIAKIFNKNINWVKKKQQHINTISELPEGSITNPKISTSIISELRKLPTEEKLTILNELNELTKNNNPLPPVSTIRKKVQEISKPKKETEPFFPSNDSTNEIEGIYKTWKRFNKILDADKTKLDSFFKSEIISTKEKINYHKKWAEFYESQLKTLQADSIRLQDNPLFD